MNGSHQVAIWAALASFFGSLLTIGVINLLTSEQWIKLAGALAISIITGASVYSKQRLDEAKNRRNHKD